MRRIAFRLDPLDVLFFRDGRPFDAATRAEGGLPNPQSLAGALRSSLLATGGFDFTGFALKRRTTPSSNLRDDLKEFGGKESILSLSFRGPWLAVADGDAVDAVEPLLPVPQCLARDPKGKWYRADPLRAELPGWKLREPERLPVWRRGNPDAKHPGGFLAASGVESFLRGGVPEDTHWLRPEDLFGFDNRTGIEIDPQALTTVESKIYGIRLLSLCQRAGGTSVHAGKRVCIYAEVIAKEESEVSFPAPLPFGGEGRQVVAQRVKHHFDWKQQQSERSSWLLTTPGFFRAQSALPDVAPARMVAAVSGTPLAVSGWDVARGGPRPTRFAVPAGSVYFVEGNFEPHRLSLCADDEDIAQGWGHVLRGTWNYV